MELQVIRNIHPVGQGAFYAETLHRLGLNNDKHIVYDCGVMPLSNRLKEEIDNFLPNNSAIDILFISHFHADHVNGIKLLSEKYKIKYVVLPQIDDYEWFYIVENYLTTGDADENIISNMKASIGDARIVQVSPIEDNDNGLVSEEAVSLDIFNGDTKAIINGYSPLVIDKNDFVLWHYIVINPLKRSDLCELRKSLESIDYDGRKLKIADLQNPNILISVRKELQEVYEKVFRGSNEYSMCMLSELAERRHYYSNSKYNKRFPHCPDCWCFCEDELRIDNVDGGLYCGDADFLHCDTLECLKRRLDGRENYIGLLQLPHHGSKENFSVELLNWLNYLKVSFACYGTPNRYNHPSSDIMGLSGTYSHVIGVNQYKSNVLTERINVWKRKLNNK